MEDEENKQFNPPFRPTSARSSDTETTTVADDPEETVGPMTEAGAHSERDVEKQLDWLELPESSPSQARQLEKQPTRERIKVEWEPNDPENPFNWKFSYKCFITLNLGILALAPSFGTSVISPASDAIAAHFGISTEVTVLSVSLFVLGFAVGPSLWAPISEVWGRRVSLLPPLFCLGFFSIGSAVSKNPQTLFITRFFSGVFGAAPVSNVAAALGDIWSRETRGTAVSFYAVMVVGGPTLAPVVGAALTEKVSWRWTEYLEAIIVFSVAILSLFTFPEVYAPVLLKRKAQRLRKETGDHRYYHPHEELKLDFKSIVTKQLSRPLVMLFTEPMVTCIAIYASFVYAVLFMTLEIFPLVFIGEHGLSPILSACSFLGLFVGVLCALTINLGNQPRYIRAVRASGGKPVPEARLTPMAIGAFIFVIGLFGFGWLGNYKSISIAAPLVFTIFIGAGFNSIFQQCINFLVDTYGLYAASATAANTFLRSLMACGLPLAVKPMFKATGIGAGMSILGAVAAAAIPVPFLFMRYGVALRKMSKFIPTAR